MNIPLFNENKIIINSFIKKGFALMCSATLCCGLLFAVPPAANTGEASDSSDESYYEIGVCMSEDNERERYFNTGFRDALVDGLGASGIRITQQEVNRVHSASDICRDFTTMGVDLIYTIGEDALSGASEATSQLPIVCAGVMDIQETLHLIPNNPGEWDRKTHTNITGVSDMPNIESQLSLMIETNPGLKAVGILYNPRDTAAIYQNELLEGYLDEAGIPWKEYELSVSGSDSAIKSGPEPVIVTPEYTVAANSKEGANIDVDSFGEDGDLTGINSPESARSTQISENWTSDMNKSKKMPKSTKKLLDLACKECDTLFIASGSSLTDSMAAIRKAASKKHVNTFGGDATLGRYTLTSMYADPYDEGYRAGQMATGILENDRDPGDIEISLANPDTVQKLYNRKLAKKYKKTFPKSFEPIDSFLKTYEPGERTQRDKNEDDEE